MTQLQQEDADAPPEGMKHQSVQTDISIGKDARDFEDYCLGPVYDKECAKQLSAVIQMNQLSGN